MPQMAPLMWSWLFLFFILSYLLFFVMNYFISPINKVDFGLETFPVNKKNWTL